MKIHPELMRDMQKSSGFVVITMGKDDAGKNTMKKLYASNVPTEMLPSILACTSKSIVVPEIPEKNANRSR